MYHLMNNVNAILLAAAGIHPLVAVEHIPFTRWSAVVVETLTYENRQGESNDGYLVLACDYFSDFHFDWFYLLFDVVK